MFPNLFQDFAKRDFHLWVHKTHNAHALHRQFPKFTLWILYRIRDGHRPKYVSERIRITLKCIMEHAEHHRQEARKLSSIDLEIKYGLSNVKMRQYRKQYEEGKQYEHDRA